MAILIKVETEEAQRNKGYASRLLKEFLAYADQKGLALDVQAKAELPRNYLAQ